MRKYIRNARDIQIAVESFRNLKPFAEEIGASYREFNVDNYSAGGEATVLSDLRKYAF